MGQGGGDERRTLVTAALAHVLHDGYTDMLYVLLPIWQAEFALGYSALALVRALYTGALAGLQVIVGAIARRLGSRPTLVAGTALAAVGLILAGFSGGLIGLCAGLAISGAGSSAQHPIGSAAVARAYGVRARGPLGVYNFTGDLGKAIVPAAMSLLITVIAWRRALWVIAILGFVTAAAIAAFMPPVRAVRTPDDVSNDEANGAGRRGFGLLFAIGVLDTSARMGLLMFLPFLLKDKGATVPIIGMALSLVFLGGAAGKFSCGWLGDRIGVLNTVLVTEGGTVAAILLMLWLPLGPTLIVLPAVGMMLNGTSSVLYGTVPDVTPPARAEASFALFYTGTIGAGAIAPIVYGGVGDLVGPAWATVGTAVTALGTVPLALALAPRLGSHAPKMT